MATDVDKFNDLFLSIMGIFIFSFNKLCTFFGTPALSLPKSKVSFLLNLKSVYIFFAFVVIKITLSFDLALKKSYAL